MMKINLYSREINKTTQTDIGRSKEVWKYLKQKEILTLKEYT